MKKLFFLLTTFMLCMSAAYVKAVEAIPSGYVSLYSLTYQTIGTANMTGTVVAGAASAQMVGPSLGWGDGIHYYSLSRYDTLAIKLTFDSADAGKQVAVRIKWDFDGVGPTIITYPTDSALLTFPTDSTRSYVYKMAMTKQRMGGMMFYNGATHWSFSYPGTAAAKPVTIDYIAVRTVPITGVNLIDSVAKIEIGKTKTLSYALIPARATNDTLVWKSSNTSVATVANGVVTGVTTGTAWIKMNSVVDSTFMDSCLVTVTLWPSNFESLYSLNYVNTVSFVQTNQTGKVLAGAASEQMVGPSNGWGDGDKYYDISKYDTLAFKLTFDTADMGKQVAARIKWDLEGVSPTIITYPTDNALLTVVNDSTRSYVYKMAMTKSRMGGMVFYNGASHWSFSYPGVAATKPLKIDYVAIQTVIATGVKVAALDTAVAAALSLGKTTTLKAVFTPVVKNNAVTWATMDSTIATVNASGLVTGSKVGTVNIKATSVTFPTLSATYAVNVVFIPVASLMIADSAVVIEIGKTKALDYSLLPLTATNDTIVWSTSDTTIATVSNGVVTALKNGTAIIKATSLSDSTKMDSCIVKVTPYPTNFESLYSLIYENTISYVQPDQTGKVIAAAASEQMVGPSLGWGDGDKYYDISKYDTLAFKLTFDTADMGKQVAARIKWDMEGVGATIITYPTDSSLLTVVNDSTRSYVYKMAMTKSHMGGMMFYNGATHWSFSYPGVAATKPVKIDYVAIQTVIATGVKVAALDSVLAAALPGGQTTTLRAVFAPVVKNNMVTWASSDTTVATVDANGVVTAGITVGTVTITATSVSFPTLSATYDVVVVPAIIIAVKTIQQDNQNALVNVYSISGLLIRRAVKVSEATVGLQKGIYIVGTKKVLITK